MRRSFVATALGNDLAMPLHPKPHHASWNLDSLPGKEKIKSTKTRTAVDGLVEFVAGLWFPLPYVLKMFLECQNPHPIHPAEKHKWIFL